MRKAVSTLAAHDGTTFGRKPADEKRWRGVSLAKFKVFMAQASWGWRWGWGWVACLRPFTPSVIESGRMASGYTDTEGAGKLQMK